MAQSLKAIFLTFVSSKLPPLHDVSFGTTYALLSVPTTAANRILLYALHKTRQFNTKSNKLTLVMNISNLSSGVITFPIATISNISSSLRTNCIQDKAAAFAGLFFAPFSFLLLSCISIDRYFGVTKMTRYNLFLNEFRMDTMVFQALLLPPLLHLSRYLPLHLNNKPYPFQLHHFSSFSLYWHTLFF